jgi:hypothetical protein
MNAIAETGARKNANDRKWKYLGLREVREGGRKSRE